MSNRKTRVLDQEIFNGSVGELKSVLSECLKTNGKLSIGKVNTEFLLRSLYDKKFYEVLSKENLLIADGKGVQWAAKYLSLPITGLPVLKQIQATWQMIYTGASLVFYPKYCDKPIPERFPGVEALRLMLSVAEKEGAPVYFFGAEQKVLNEAIKKLKIEFPKLKVAGSSEGWHYDEKKVIEDINKTKPALLIVALGSPRQEFWIVENLPKLKTVKVAVGEGGSLDRIAAPAQKAPKIINLLGLEWLWRLLFNKSKTQTGSRLKRVWNAVPVFIYEVVKYKIKNNEK